MVGNFDFRVIDSHLSTDLKLDETHSEQNCSTELNLLFTPGRIAPISTVKEAVT